MSVIDPSGISLFFDIIDSKGETFSAFLDINDFNGFSCFDVRYKRPSDPTWTFLTAPDIDPKDTSEEQDAEVGRLLAIINDKIKEVFGKDANTAPEFGIERVRWLLKNGGIQATGNELKLR